MDISGAVFRSQNHVHGDIHQHASHARTPNPRMDHADQDSDGDSGGISESHFRSSAASQGQDLHENTGTYQVTQVQFFSAAAMFLLGQTGPSQSTQSSPAPTDPTTQTTPVTDGSATTPAQNGAVTLQTAQSDAPQTVSQSTIPATGSNATPNTTGTATSSTQDPLQAFNSALKSLGLTDQQISAFDQVANFINSVSPAIFADLVSQFQALAQQSTQGSQNSTGATTSSATSTLPTGAPSPAATTPPTFAPPNGGYQIEELSIRFSGVEVQGTTGNTNGDGSATGGTFDVSKFNLSIREVQVTLADGNGQNSQIASPQPVAPGNSSTVQTSAPSGTIA
jgi:hypothetical protein